MIPILLRESLIVESKTFISYSSRYLTTKIQSRYVPENTNPFVPRYVRQSALPEGEKPRKENKRSIANEAKKAKTHANTGLRYTPLKKDAVDLSVCL